MNPIRNSFNHLDKNPEYYYIAPDNNLAQAISLAISLSRPLLITGEPGVGKTQLAHWAAYYLSRHHQENALPFRSKPYIFITKSKSESSDLFYYYDAISHFRDKNESKTIEHYMQLAGMGLAIAQTLGKDELLRKYPNLQSLANLNDLENQAMSSVLLIDEIDKAPRDFTNDLLDEIENTHFSMKELNQTISRSENPLARNLLILTSNSESNLPEPFLRRCLFYHIEFPTEKELVQILMARLSPLLQAYNQGITDHEVYLRFQAIIKLFYDIRNHSLHRKPSIGELIDWVKVLNMENLFSLFHPNFSLLDLHTLPEDVKKQLYLSFLALLKNVDDFNAITHNH
jgi:MoxR-like ATPase